MTIGKLQEKVHRIAVDHGWWDKERPIGEALMLIVTEVSEAMEAYRIGNPQSEAIPGFSRLEEELADVIIRVLDLAQGSGLDIEGAIAAKIRYNETRDYRHGGKLA